MKVWTITHFSGYVTGVFFDKETAVRCCGPNDNLEEWEPMMTPTSIATMVAFVKENYL